MASVSIRRPQALYRRSDPEQMILRKVIGELSDQELSELEADIVVFMKYGEVSENLGRFLSCSYFPEITAA